MDRDRRVLALLAEHKVLTTNQIAAIEFASVRRAQDRLRQLRELGVVFTFRESYAHGGTSQTRYALGYLGKRLIAARRAEKPPAPKAYSESLERLALWPKLKHQLDTNEFFCSLAAYRNPARTREGSRAGEVGRLTQWWSEKRCTEFFWAGSRDIVLRPDGYGCWEEQDRAVRFFLEHDTGTESLSKVTRKLDDYSVFPTNQFGILLFSVHSTRREIALRRALGRRDPGVVIATSARDHGNPDGAAGPIWGLWTPGSGGAVSRRWRLAELPARGPDVEHSLPDVDQPYNEAAFDPKDQAILGLLATPKPELTALTPVGYGAEDELDDDVTLYDDADDDSL